jgi:hypothetical protein
MKERITQFIKEHPSYTKKGTAFLANKFKCSERTIKQIMNSLKDLTKSYRVN